MNPVELPIAGFHHGIPYEVYAAWPAINFSRLKPIRETASKCKFEMDHPKKPTPAMILGSALHVAVLEPARFEQLFFICPPCDRRTAEGKEIFAKAEKDAVVKLMIRSGAKEDEALMGQLQDLRGMSASIRAMKATAPFLSGAGQNEVSMLWKDEETGLWCKGRMDRYLESLALLNGRPVVVEIKTARDASEWGFGKAADVQAYAAQAACYRAGVKAITGKSPIHIFIAVENKAPYDAAVFTLDDASLQTGALLYRQMLDRFAECTKTGAWPGYVDQVQVLSMPKYAHMRNYAD